MQTIDSQNAAVSDVVDLRREDLDPDAIASISEGAAREHLELDRRALLAGARL